MEINKRLCVRRLAAASAALVFAFGAVPSGADPLKGISLFAPITASAGELRINSSDVTIYAVSKQYKELLPIPADFPRSFQLEVKNAENVSFRCSSKLCIKCSERGLISVDGDNVAFGDYTVKCTADGRSFDVSVHVVDYGQMYADEVIDKFIKENINKSMSAKDKIDKIASFVAEKRYDTAFDSVQGMMISGGGDSRASAETIIYMAKKIGLDGWIRNGSRDPGAAGNHVNAMVTDGKKYYEVEAGYSDEPPRYYYVKERNTLYSTRYSSKGDGIEIYQYDGKEYPEVLEIPSELEGKPVVSIGESAFCYGRGVKEVVIPDTVKSIDKNAFYGMDDLERINIPASVKTMGVNPFAHCNKLTEFKCAEESDFTSDKGVLYREKGSVIVSAPAVSEIEIGSGVKEIGGRAFWGNDHIEKINVPATVGKIGDLAFGKAENLQILNLEEGLTAPLPMGLVYQTKVTELYIPESVTEAYIPAEIEKIYRDSGIGVKDFYKTYCLKTLKGFAGSLADTYARENGLVFRESDRKSRIHGASLSLGGNIDVNIYVKPALDAVSRGAYAVIKGPNDGDGKKLVFRDNSVMNDSYKLTCRVSARQMDEKVTVQLFEADGTPITADNSDGSTTFLNGYTFSVKNYIDAVENQDSDPNDTKAVRTKELMTAMKNYGAFAQKYFDGSSFLRDDELPNQRKVTESVLDEHKAVIDNQLTGGDATYSYSLILRSETTLRFYYDAGSARVKSVTVKNADGTDVQNAVFGTKNTGSGEMHYVDIPDIAANELGRRYELCVAAEDETYLRVNASPMSYVYTVIQKCADAPSQADLCNVVRALYKYYQAADKFAKA